MSTTKQKSIILTNGEHLVVKEVGEDYEAGTGFYRALLSSAKSSQGFEGDRGPINEGETIDTITDRLETWCEDNLNS